MTTLPEFDTAYRAAWRQPERVTPRVWAERYRVLSRRQSSRPGRWTTEAAPALAGILDLCGMPQVRRLNILKAAQVGASEAVRNFIGYMADREPDPVLLNLPDERRGRKVFADRIIPLIQDTPRLRALATDDGRDQTLSQVTLANGFSIALAWSGSASSLAADPIRVVVNDEVDKFQQWTGAEADPISLAEARTLTFANSLVVNMSTPTTRAGQIFRLHDGSPVKLAFYSPCPHCRHEQTLRFDHLKWDAPPDVEDKTLRAAAVLQNRTAWYECERCAQRILDHQRGPMLCAGYWATPDRTFRLYVDGRQVGELPDDCEVGLTLGCLLNLAAGHAFPAVAAEFIRSTGDPQRTQNFVNSYLAEVFEEQVARTKPNAIREKVAISPPAGIVPQWATAIVATADTQAREFWFTIRAWGYDYRSQLLHYGRVTSFEELARVALGSAFAVDGHDSLRVRPSVLLIDSGGTRAQDAAQSRTNEVYQFAMTDPGRIWPTKGASRPMPRPWTLSHLPSGVTLRVIDVGYFKDMLHRLINDPDQSKWLPNADAGEDYCRQLVSEHKVIDRRNRREMWLPVTSGAANHLFDAEVLQCAAADMGNLGLIKPDTAAEPQPERQQEEAPRVANNWLNSWRGRY